MSVSSLVALPTILTPLGHCFSETQLSHLLNGGANGGTGEDPGHGQVCMINAIPLGPLLCSGRLMLPC